MLGCSKRRTKLWAQATIGNEGRKESQDGELTFQVVAYAQRDIAIINTQQLKVMEEQSQWESQRGLLSLRVADIDVGAKDFFLLWQEREMQKFKKKCRKRARARRKRARLIAESQEWHLPMLISTQLLNWMWEEGRMTPLTMTMLARPFL